MSPVASKIVYSRLWFQGPLYSRSSDRQVSRPGVERNLAWLRDTHGGKVDIEIADIQDFQGLRQAVRGVGRVFHFAAQVAVTTSLTSPFQDFEVNARGTLNLLEALRELPQPPPLVFNRPSACWS